MGEDFAGTSQRSDELRAESPTGSNPIKPDGQSGSHTVASVAPGTLGLGLRGTSSEQVREKEKHIKEVLRIH